jgi:hypothetical protein
LGLLGGELERRAYRRREGCGVLARRAGSFDATFEQR